MATLMWTQLGHATDLPEKRYFILDSGQDGHIKHNYVESLSSVTYGSDIPEACGIDFIIFPGDVDFLKNRDISCVRTLILIGVDPLKAGGIKHKKMITFLPTSDLTAENVQFAKYILKSDSERGVMIHLDSLSRHSDYLRSIKTNEQTLVNDIYAEYKKKPFEFVVVPHDSAKMVTGLNIRSFLITLSRLNIPVIGGSDERYIKSGFMAGVYIDHKFVIDILNHKGGFDKKNYKAPFVYIVNKFVAKRFRINVKEYRGQEVVLQ
jgi:hypothetical protein